MKTEGNPIAFQPDGRADGYTQGEKEVERKERGGMIEISAALPMDWIVGLKDIWWMKKEVDALSK